MMKNFFLLLVLCLSLNSCMAQKTNPIPRIVIPLTVTTIAGEEITLQSENGHLLLAHVNPDAFTLPKGMLMEEGRKYLVSFEDLDCKNCFKRKVKIIAFSVYPQQASKDAAKIKTLYK